MRRRLSAGLCNGILCMRQTGSSQKDIVQDFWITQLLISIIPKRHLETGLTTPRPKSGCSKKITARHDQNLLWLCRNSRTKTLSQLRVDWILFSNVHVATGLVNYRLLNVGYLARRLVRKSLLQKRHRQARFVWVCGQLNWYNGHWQTVVFSDESRILLYSQYGHVRMLRQAYEV